MLRFLTIRHFAVIDAVEIEFDQGLNVLTGETGAGKSILVEAVGLLLGDRASGDLVRTGEETASVEAIFEAAGTEVLLRREITAQGRSRAFIDGALATAGALKDLSGRLIELHGQHQHQTLLDPETHLVVLDGFGSLGPLAASTAAVFEAMRTTADELSRLRRAAAERSARQELAEFQLSELERADLRAGEDESLLAERQVLASAERVERLCAESYGSLYERDGAVLAELGGVWRRVAELAGLDPQFRPYLDAREGIKSQLEDLALFLRHYAAALDASPGRLQQVEERLSLIERLKKKHGPSLADVIARRDALRRELGDLEYSDQRITELERQYASARQQYLDLAQGLSARRREAARSFAQDLEASLAELAMERTRFEVRFNPEPLDETAWTGQGIDRAEFFISPNVGEEPRPLARIVSGGELSRVMLAIKTLAPSGGGASAQGMIFDEIDAGIGGRVADVVGRKLRALGSGVQVLCITHLPQIAASADAHFRIEKHVDGGRTRTSVSRLDDRGRVEELSRMLGGAGITETIRASALEMLSSRREAAGRRQSRPGSGRATPKK